MNGFSPVRSISMTPSSTSPTSLIPHSPSDISSSSASQLRAPLSTITPIKINYPEKTKPRPLTKRMGFKRAVMQKFKITKHNR